MSDETLPAKIVDGFDIDANDETASPIRGGDLRFKDGDYVVFGEEIDVTGKSYAVIDRRQGWQKLEQGCPPEYLMRKLGEPRPARPHVAEEDWPLNLNDKPAHPWRWTTYLSLLDIATGEISTFWTNTIGGNRAVGELADQVAFMRQLRPNAIPVVALKSRDQRASLIDYDIACAEVHLEKFKTERDELIALQCDRGHTDDKHRLTD